MQEFLRVQGIPCAVVVRAGRDGVKAADLADARAALVEFAEEMYRPLVRGDQRGCDTVARQ